MNIIDRLVHLLIPRESNNHRAKIIHPSGLVVISLLLISFQSVISFTPKIFPSVLGYASSISPTEVIRLTNERRVSSGLSPLSENSTLSSAALAKGNDMLAKGYWAHFAPDGTSPWKFFTSFGYKYRYAGENLARDFSSPSAAVDAWMNSPTHRDNILNSSYKEIGIGVVEGSLSGVDTTIIVQFFGTKAESAPSIPVVKAGNNATSIPKATLNSTSLAVSPTPVPTSVSSTVQEESFKVSPFESTKKVSMIIIGVLLLVFGVDLIIIRRNRIMRMGGRTIAHIAYLAMILAATLILKAGQII